MTISNTAWAMRQTLPPTYKLLLIYLVEWADQDGDVEKPTIGDMAKFCGVTEQRIESAIEELDHSGYIHRRLSSRNQGTYVIRLNTDRK